MTVVQLKAKATEMGVDLPSNAKKAEIEALIQRATEIVTPEVEEPKKPKVIEQTKGMTKVAERIAAYDSQNTNSWKALGHTKDLAETYFAGLKAGINWWREIGRTAKLDKNGVEYFPMSEKQADILDFENPEKLVTNYMKDNVDKWGNMGIRLDENGEEIRPLWSGHQIRRIANAVLTLHDPKVKIAKRVAKQGGEINQAAH